MGTARPTATEQLKVSQALHKRTSPRDDPWSLLQHSPAKHNTVGDLPAVAQLILLVLTRPAHTGELSRVSQRQGTLRIGPVCLQLFDLVLQGYTNYQLDPSKGNLRSGAQPGTAIHGRQARAPPATTPPSPRRQLPARRPAVPQQVNPSPSTQCQNLCEGLEFQTHYHRYRF